MRSRLKKERRIVAPIILLVIFSLIIGSYFYISNKHKQGCFNPYEVKDSSSRKEQIRNCDDVLYRGSLKVVEKKDYPDLFQYVFNGEKPQPVTQSVRVFERDNDEYVSVKSLVDYRTWNTSAIGVFRKEKDKYTLVFKKTFEDNVGRWVNIEFGEDTTSRDSYFYINTPGEGISISGDIGYLGCLGACRMLWWDFYDWDSAKRTYVLANNKHPENFKLLLKNYEDLDKSTCKAEADIEESISSLYPTRKDKEKYCSDAVQVPFTSAGEAEMLLRGIKAINLILQGQNIPRSEVSKISLP